MTIERNDQALWLEWSGLPLELNKVRAGAWMVFKKIVELDCRAHQAPGTVEVSLAELAERCGLEPEVAARILEALNKKKYLLCFIPDHIEEPALIEIRMPLKVPRSPEAIAPRIPDPALRDVTSWRYTGEKVENETDVKKIQEVVDLYLNLLSQKMNVFIFDQLEIVARRFTIEEIRHTMERAARHELRTIGWVLKELVRDHAKKAKANM